MLFELAAFRPRVAARAGGTLDSARQKDRRRVPPTFSRCSVKRAEKQTCGGDLSGPRAHPVQGCQTGTVLKC